MDFRIDVFAWIPQADVPNPLHSLPGGTATWGPGACGPRFGGDNFTKPPASHSAWSGTYRARQSFAFSAASFGAVPAVTHNPGVTPGLTTVLTGTRAAGGTICHSLTATVKTSSASVSWVASDNWYEAKVKGAAQDPVPAAVAKGVAGGTAGAAVSGLTPNLEWDLTLRFQSGGTLGLATRARYAISAGLNMDVSATSFPTPTSFGATGNLFHGLATVRRFPSYVVYVSIGSGAAATTIPVYFANATSRNLGEIVIGQTDPIRQLAF
ncbi:MAG TPA: hypothetical protein VJ890_26035 [Vineibacter sp.]|nr:hypothetical protein [Vineibacter sp.]